ncbi:hypothetical protein VIGAN_07095000, partial [Vigna angularis var. angularis]
KNSKLYFLKIIYPNNIFYYEIFKIYRNAKYFIQRRGYCNFNEFTYLLFKELKHGNSMENILLLWISFAWK